MAIALFTTTLGNAQQAVPESNPAQLRVILLGTQGGPTFNALRIGIGTLVTAGPERLLFDAGRSMTTGMARAAVNPADVTRVFLTHLHSDHVISLPELIISRLRIRDVRFRTRLAIGQGAHKMAKKPEENNMPRFVFTAEVEDLEKWEKGFRTHGDLFRQMAISKMEYATTEGSRIVVSGEITNLDAYMKVFNSPATAEAMALDGIKRETVKMFIVDKEWKL